MIIEELPMNIKKEGLSGSLLNTLLDHLNLSGNDTWNHDELCGQLAMNAIGHEYKVTYNEARTEADKGIYHLSLHNGPHRHFIDDLIFSIDYITRKVRIIALPRPVVTLADYKGGHKRNGSNNNNGNSLNGPQDTLIQWPLFDGTVFHLFQYEGQTYMSSRNSLDISDKAFFDKSFIDIFCGLIGHPREGIWNVFDPKCSYVISMTSTENCLYSETVNEYHILETWNPETEELILHDHSNIGTNVPIGTVNNAFGTIYRTEHCVFIQASPLFKEISKAIYNVDNKRIGSISQATGCTNGHARKVYIVFRAILTGSVEHFCDRFPSLVVLFNKVIQFIESISRIIWTQCNSRTKNPKYEGTFIGAIVRKIGPLKTSSGIYVVYDAIYDITCVQMMATEFIRSERSGSK